MAQTADQLRAEIAQTRKEMGRTIEELNTRVEETRRKLSLSEQVRRNPLAIVGGAIAGGLLLGLLRGRKR
jgi:ElaB/YqjD/DUF883 family membrane-anchored ribosome-binding protein